MKKIFFSAAIFVLLSATAIAQTYAGFQIGGNLATTQVKSSGIILDTKPRQGFLIGIVGQKYFTSKLSFRTEFNFIQKGYKYSTATSEDEASLNYIEVPINIIYSIKAGGGKLFFGAGPNVARGLSGVYRSKTTTGSKTNDIRFDLGGADAFLYLKPIDLGANALVGYEFSERLSANVSYTFGLKNISTYSEDSYKNRGLALKLTYMYGGKL